MIMRTIRNKRRAFRIPMIIFTIALSISLVGFFTHSPLEVGQSQQLDADNEIQAMLDYSRQLEQAAKLEPDNHELQVSLGDIFYDLGIVYAGLGDHEQSDKYLKEATKPYLKALELDPNLINARVDLATAAYYSGQHELAEEHFQEAVSQDPEFINGRINYGHFLFFAQNDVEGALEQWELALELDPDPTTKSNLEALIEHAKEHNE